MTLPSDTKAQLRRALQRRAKLAKANGVITATTISGWALEMAQQTINSFK